MNTKIRSEVQVLVASLELGLAQGEADFLAEIVADDIDPDDLILIFRTQRDSKVDDVICFPLDGEEFLFEDPLRPVIPEDTHPNCRCFWEDSETGDDLGQDGFGFAAFTADTFEGKEGQWRTVRGTPVFFPDGEDPKDAIDKAFKGKQKSPIKTKTKLPSEGVRFPEARKKHQEFIKGRENQNYTFDPTTNMGFDAFNEDSAKEFYKENSDGKSDLYIISATNHQGQLSRESESAFIQVKNEGSKPLVGHWVSDDTGFDYTDISFPKNEGMNDDGAKSLLKKFNQESALVISSNGKARFLDA